MKQAGFIISIVAACMAAAALACGIVALCVRPSRA